MGMILPLWSSEQEILGKSQGKNYLRELNYEVQNTEINECWKLNLTQFNISYIGLPKITFYAI